MPEYYSCPAIVYETPSSRIGSQAPSAGVGIGTPHLSTLLPCELSHIPKNAEVLDIFRELVSPIGQCYKGLNYKMNFKGPGRVRAPVNVGARRDLRDNKPIDS